MHWLDFAPHIPWLIGLVALPAIMLAWLLRRAEMPGGRPACAILAGAVISIIAGPSVMARVQPDLYGAHISGGLAHRELIAQKRSDQVAEMSALLESGVSEQAVEEARARHTDELEPLVADLQAAQEAHRDQTNWLVIAIVGLHILLTAPSMMPRTPCAFRAALRGLVDRNLLGVRIALASAVLAVAAPMSIGLLLGYSWRGSIGLGVVFGIGGLSAALTGRAFAVAGVSLLACLALLVPTSYSPHLFALGGVLLVSLMIATGIPPRTIQRVRAPLWRAASGVTLPALVSIALVRTEYYTASGELAFWIILVMALLWSSDGRWFTASVAARWCAPKGSELRENPWRLATQILDAGAGSAQIIIAIALTASDKLPLYVLPCAVAGAALIEVTRGARAWFERLIQFQNKLERESEERDSL